MLCEQASKTLGTWRKSKFNPNILSRWVKEMAEAGIDVSKYNTHSCGSAPSTGALYKWVHIEDILKQGDWSNLKSV